MARAARDGGVIMSASPSCEASSVQVAILLYPGVTALDAVGPYEVLSRVPGVSVVFVSASAGPVRTDTGAIALHAEALDAARRPTVVIVPGGIEGTMLAARDQALLAWLRSVSEGAEWVVSVCTGAIVLGAAGLLEGKRATTHWLATGQLARFGAEFEDRRVVVDGRIITAQGVSAGIDMALLLASRLSSEPVAKAIQLFLEYDPEPPFDSGSPAKADEATREFARSLA